MIKLICVQRIRDKNGIIVNYILQNSKGERKQFKPDAVRQLIRQGKIDVVNLRLTADGRIIKIGGNDGKQVVQNVNISAARSNKVANNSNDKSRQIVNQSNKAVNDKSKQASVQSNRQTVANTNKSNEANIKNSQKKNHKSLGNMIDDLNDKFGSHVYSRSGVRVNGKAIMFISDPKEYLDGSVRLHVVSKMVGKDGGLNLTNFVVKKMDDYDDNDNDRYLVETTVVSSIPNAMTSVVQYHNKLQSKVVLSNTELLRELGLSL